VIIFSGPLRPNCSCEAFVASDIVGEGGPSGVGEAMRALILVVILRVRSERARGMIALILPALVVRLRGCARIGLGSARWALTMVDDEEGR
jgi:hypothetical protein